MLTSRQAIILKIIVNEFIKTNQAVGSKRILELFPTEISSATIRNECVFLEKAELLEKQHTSSGRIPSTKGYRFFVDNLMDVKDEKSSEQLKEYLKNIIFQRGIQIDNVLDQATMIISEMTKMSAIVAKKEEDTSHVKLKKIDLVPLSDTMASAIFVLSNGEIHKKVFDLQRDISLDDLKVSIDLFSDTLIDTVISEIENKANKIKPKLEKSVKNHEYVLQSFIAAILTSNHDKKEIVGMKYMLENPEFSDTNKLMKVITLMEEVSPFDWYESSYLQNKSTVNIVTKIGNEVSSNIDDIAILETEIKLNNSSRSLTLVGPKRVDYAQASQLINILLEILEGKENGG